MVPQDLVLPSWLRLVSTCHLQVECPWLEMQPSKCRTTREPRLQGSIIGQQALLPCLWHSCWTSIECSICQSNSHAQTSLTQEEKVRGVQRSNDMNKWISLLQISENPTVSNKHDVIWRTFSMTKISTRSKDISLKWLANWQPQTLNISQPQYELKINKVVHFNVGKGKSTKKVCRQYLTV